MQVAEWLNVTRLHLVRIRKNSDNSRSNLGIWVIIWFTDTIARRGVSGSKSALAMLGCTPAFMSSFFKQTSLCKQTRSDDLITMLFTERVGRRGVPGAKSSRAMLGCTCASSWQARRAGEGDWQSSCTQRWRIHSIQSSLVYRCDDSHARRNASCCTARVHTVLVYCYSGVYPCVIYSGCYSGIIQIQTTVRGVPLR